MPPEKPHWAELFTEVVTSGLCTGCAGCVVACPYDVLSYDDTGGRYKPFHIDADGGPDELHPRGEGLHHVHPGLPPVPTVGARDRHPPVRPRAHRPRRWPASPRTSCWSGPPIPRSTSWARTAGWSRPC